MGINKFEFERSRGIIWVCDLVESSKFLNDNVSADALEEFLPRLYWTSAMAVESAGGQLIKWTGDGFLAWFETPLLRLLPEKASHVFLAAYTMSNLVTISQLGVKADHKFRVRHGICFEHDALIIKIFHSSHQSLDVIGRGVVLAFRLSGLPSGYPGITTQKDLVAASAPPQAYSWRKRVLSAEEKLKFFKGEKWGTSSVFVSSGRIRKPRSIRSTARSIKRALSEVDGSRAAPIDTFIAEFVPRMLKGPSWCRDTIQQYYNHTIKLYQFLQKVLPEIERVNCECKSPEQP